MSNTNKHDLTFKMYLIMSKLVNESEDCLKNTENENE